MAQQQHSAQETAQALVASPKGLLAVDETPRTLTSRFDALGIESTAESRRDYRELLFRAAGIDAHISGAILNDETLRQQAADSTPIAQVLIQRGIMPGVKVDTGIHPLAAAPNEGITEGLDGLRPRLNEYREMGVRFCKWRAVYTIGPGTPSRTSIAANNHALARYAALCQETGLAPVVESEVLLDGNHSIEQCYHATETVLLDLFSQCAMQRVLPEGLLLKVNMVISGKDAPQRAGAQEVADRTVSCLRRTVPAAVPGVVFLSGGQIDDEAVVNLNAICGLAASVGAPWQVSFSYARALQGAPMRAWAGKPENTTLAQETLRRRALVTSAARQAQYRPELAAE